MNQPEPSRSGYTFLELLQDDKVVDFNWRLVLSGYSACLPDRQADISKLVEQAFSLLLTARSQEELEQAQQMVYTRVFRKPEPDFWFNQVYAAYKRETKPRQRFAQVQRWISGQQLLDLGCGDGLFSLLLHEHGYQVLMTDVLDYRNESAGFLSFTPMDSPSRIPYPSRAFDTAFVFSVLHHIASENLLPLLTDLRRVAKRVVVDEDGLGLPEDMEGLATAREYDPFLREFEKLPLEEQRKRVIFMDYFANAVSQGIVEMNMPYNFHSPGEWDQCFSAAGFRTIKSWTTGFEPVHFHRSCHIWFVLE